MNQHQPKQTSQQSNLSHLNQKRSSPFDVSTNFGFNSFIGSTQNNPSTQTSSNMHSQYFNNQGFPFNNQAQTNNESLFGTQTPNHCCDDTPMNQNRYGNKAADDSSFFNKFEEDSFLHNLHAGQRLNSEVIIRILFICSLKCT